MPAATLLPLLSDPSPRVRAEAATALGRLRAPEAEPLLIEALDGAESELGEHAAEALLALGTPEALERAFAWVSGEADSEARAELAARMELPKRDDGVFESLVIATLARLSPDDAAYEPLLELRLKLLSKRPVPEPAQGPSLDDSIVKSFPRYVELAQARGFEPLARSLRTAESLHGAATGIRDADHSPPIVLWMKALEGYVHAWLGSRLQSLQRQPGVLFDHVDQLVHTAWPSYQRFVRERWQDEFDVGGTRVEVPLRSLANVLREYQERRTKRLDAPLSVTEWARLMVFFAVDHPSGPKNLLRVRSTSAERTVRLCHRLAVLAAVRNVVTHRAVAAERTADAFRGAYYAAFEELAGMA